MFVYIRCSRYVANVQITKTLRRDHEARVHRIIRHEYSGDAAGVLSSFLIRLVLGQVS